MVPDEFLYHVVDGVKLAKRTEEEIVYAVAKRCALLAETHAGCETDPPPHAECCGSCGCEVAARIEKEFDL